MKYDYPDYVKILIVISFIFISFGSGFFFQNWGGIERLAPIMINFIRNNILGDRIVLETEKKVFSFHDFVKRKFYKSENNITDFKPKENINENVKTLINTYIEDNTNYNGKDYYELSKLLNNYSPDIEPIFKYPVQNEGKWGKFFISPETLKPLYAKTFLRPDTEREYARVYIYKFDMDRLKLEFIPGFDDSDDELCDGGINHEQYQTVLWGFSGGFQYQHGWYGMKYKGKIILPPKIGAATLFMFKDGTYKMSEWTKDTKDSDDIIAFRQNELLLVIDGKITPKINRLWGGTPEDVDPIYTVRTGLGFDKNGNLIFAFGESLSAKTLAVGMIKAGVVTGMHLDMNYYNTHLVRFERTSKGRLKSYNENDVLCYYKNMYTYPFKRDYFILTSK